MHNGDHSLAQLIDVARLQRTCEGLSAATGVTLAVLEPDGTVLISSGWQDICTRFHRVEPGTAAGCLESDTRINERVLAGADAPAHIAYRCANGLWDVAFPLLVDGSHIATVFTGQFFYDDDMVDAEEFRGRALEHGFDETAYLDALAGVPVLSHEQVEQTISFLADLVGMLSESGLNALRQHEARGELQQSQEILRAVLDTIPARVFWKDLDGCYLGANAPFARDAGLDRPEDLIGRDDFAMGWRDQAELYRADDRAVAESGEPRLNIEEPQTTPEGDERTLLTSKVPLRDADGEVIGVLGTYLDVSDRKDAERRLEESRRLVIDEQREAAEALRRSRAQYETFINATDDITFLKDADLRYIMVNTANARFFGRTVDEIRGHTDAELMSPEAAAACDASDLRALKARGVVVTTEVVGDKVYESRKFPVGLEGGGVGVGGYVRDVTEQRRVDAEIRRLASDLERRVEQRTSQLAATNKELESFAYSISHDLRSPLRALDGFSEILLQDYSAVLDEEGRGYLRRIKGAANHMAGLMDGLLQLSRLNREEMLLERVDLSGLAWDVVDELRRQEPDRSVEAVVESDLWAEADPKLMRVALANLIGNAWKFTSRHDRACIEVGSAPVAGDHGDVAFYVRDDGAGFDQRYARNLFGAFQRLHTPDQFEGTGIGLATVQRIVHRHGGRVWAEGEVEKGATFWFTLAPDTA